MRLHNRSTSAITAHRSGGAGPGLLARVLTATYCEHLSLYRQCEILARHGADSALQLGGCLLPVNGSAG